MPRVAGYRIAEIRELGRQLRYAPGSARRRHMEATEMLLREIEPDQVYPREFVVFRITGYRPDGDPAPVTVTGSALRADLATLIQRLSESLDLPADGGGRRAIPFVEVARRLNVSKRTAQRYRRSGLVCHYVVFDRGVKQLACFEDALECFIGTHRDALSKARAFRRVDPATRESMIVQARELRRQGSSLNTAARILARHNGRAHETVRAILRRHDRSSERPIFDERRQLGERDARLILRAITRGIAPGFMARRFGKTRTTIHRQLNRARLARIERLELSWVELPTLHRDDAAMIILAAPAVTKGLSLASPSDDVIAIIEWAHETDDDDAATESALLGGYNLLKRRASRATAECSTWGAAAVLDAVETDLRWATLLKRRLVLIGLPASLRATEQWLGRSLLKLPAEAMVRLVQMAVAEVAAVVETTDPSRDQRLPARSSFAVDRALAARTPVARTDGRAAVRHRSGAIRSDDLLGAVTPWQPWLDLRADLQCNVSALEEQHARAVTMRWGLDGTPPRRLAVLADDLDTTVPAVSATLRQSIVALRKLVRGE